MSQLALGYIVPPELIAPLSELASAKKYAEFWKSIQAAGTAVHPAYPYSGYVVAVLLPFLSDKGIDLPMNLETAPLRALAGADVGLLACADGKDAKDALDSLSKCKLDVEEMAHYFAEFTGEDWDDSGKAMTEARRFVEHGLESVRDLDVYYLLFVG
ncbi:MAG TPA: hypothetical protein V6D22_03085 [Candidatus Obscuribacterales bacterium]